MDLRDRIRELAKKKGLSLPKLEEELGFGNGTIVKWDKAKPNVDKLKKVADYLNVSLDYLVDGKEIENSIELSDVYLRLAKGAQDLGLGEEDVTAILNLYKTHQDKNK